MLILVLFGACLGSQLGELIPGDVSHKSSATLMETVQNNPRSFIKMLAGADPATLQTIIDLLAHLKDQAEAEETRLQDQVTSATNAWQSSDAMLQALILAYDQRALVLTQATLDYEAAVGNLNAVSEEHTRETPILQNEMDVYTDVLNVLNTLLNGQDQSQSLLDAGLSVTAKKWQRMIVNVKADPEKLEKIIDLIERMNQTSYSEQVLLDTRLTEAESNKNTTLTAKVEAASSVAAAENARDAQQTATDTLHGKLQEATTERDQNLPNVQTEISTLDDVISILSQMKDEQE